MKTCTKCGVIKPLDEFHKSSRNKCGRISACAICINNANRIEYKKHPEKMRERRRKWYKENARKSCARFAEYRRTVHGRAVGLVGHARSRAKNKNITFKLTKSWVEERLEHGVCERTGLKFDITGEERNAFTPSIDQIIPSAGYTPENCQVVVFGYNALKCDFTHEDAMVIARALVKKELE